MVPFGLSVAPYIVNECQSQIQAVSEYLHTEVTSSFLQQVNRQNETLILVVHLSSLGFRLSNASQCAYEKYRSCSGLASTY